MSAMPFDYSSFNNTGPNRFGSIGTQLHAGYQADPNFQTDPTQQGPAPFDYNQYFSQSPASLAQQSGSPLPSNPYQGTTMSWDGTSPGGSNRQQWGYDANWGNLQNQNIAGQQQTQQNLANYYQQPLNQALGNLGQTPGYTDQELQQIARPDQYQQGVTTQAQYQANQPTSQQQAAMTGNTGSYKQYFNPSQLQNINAQSAQGQRQQLYNAQQGQTDAIADLQQNYGAALDPNALGVSSGYGNTANNLLSQGTQNVQGVLNSGQLQMDPNLAGNYLMSDKELQGLQDSAARTVQLNRQSALENIQRKAVAGGNADPMALAALQKEYQRGADADAADASTNAYLQGRNQQAQRQMNLEQTRLGAAQNYGNLATQNYQALTNQGLNQNNAGEQMRLGANQGLANMQLGAANNLANQQMGAAQWGGNAGVGVEQGIGNQAQNTGQYITNTGTGINQTADTANTNRAANLYNTQNANNQYAQQNTYNQNMGVQGAQSQAYTNAANARINGQNTLIGGLNTNANNAADRGVTLGGQQLQAGATTLGNMNQSLSNWGNYDVAKLGQGFGNSFQNSLGSSLGKTIGSPSFSLF